MRVRVQVLSSVVLAGLICLAVLWLGSAAPLFAQSTSTGTVAGTVTDPSGAVVSGASITLTDLTTRTARTDTTNQAGRYIFVDVAPGTYEITVTKQGFATSKGQTTVKVGEATTANLSLQVGGSSVVVEVQAAGNELQTMNATVGNTITSAALDALPSIGRDVSTFVELQPGVTPEGSVAGAVNDQSYFSLDGGNNSNDMDGNMSTYTATYAGDPTGGVAAQNYFWLGVGNPTGVMPTPQDSVEEFKVNTAGQTADFNSSAGAEVKVVTKRGTSAWHGTAYEYYLDNNWSSNSWQNNAPGAHVGLPTFHYSRFGGAIGGPIIPKELLGGKTYAFFNWEGFRWPGNSVTIYRDVPSPALRLGLITDATNNTIYNLNPKPVPYNGITYPGNSACIGTQCVTSVNDPRGIGLNPLVSQIWNKYEPQSNSVCHNTLCDGTNVLGFTANVNEPQKNNFMVGRIDHDFSAKWHFMSSYRYFKFGTNATGDQVDIGGFFSGDTLGTPTSQSGDPQQAWYLVAGLTTNITPNVTNDFHYSFLRNWWQWSRAGDTPELPGLGGALEIFSGESNGHYENLAPYNVNTQQTRTRFWDGHDQMFRDDLSMLHGNHLFQFGGQYQHNFNWHQRTDNGGGINYQPVYQLGVGASGSEMAADLPFCSIDPVNSKASGISNCPALTAASLGIVSISQIAYTRSGPNLTLNPPLTPAFDQSTIPFYNVYFSDTWHMKPTLTFTYGLGWTLEMPPVEKNGKQVELVDQNDQPVSAPDYLAARKRAALLGQVFNPEVGFALVGNTGSGLKYPYNPFYGEFSPRVAVAWNPHFDADTTMGKIFGHEDSVIRGGYGRVYGRLNGVDLVLVPLLGTGLIQPVQDFAPVTNASKCFNNQNQPVSTCAANVFRVGIDSAPGPGTYNAPLPTPSQTLPQPDYPGFNAIAAGAGESLDPNFRPNVVDSFNFTVQRQLSRKFTLELGYIGRRITHEYQPININAVPYMMTKGGQQFAQAYANVVLQYCGGAAGMAGGACTANAGAVTPQPFFEAAMNTTNYGGVAGKSYCAGYTSCTAAVVANEGKNFAGQQVWTLWSDLDNGGFNFPRSMMNTPISALLSPTYGGQGQLSSGVAVNASVGHGNYNAGFASLKTADWNGVTAQSNFTWSKALGTGALVQATSGYTPDDDFNLNEMYGPQFYNRKFVYNQFIVYSPPFYKGQSEMMGRLLGGWTFSTVFTTGSGQPNQIWTTGFSGQEFGSGDAVNFNSLATAVPIGPLPAHGHAYGTPGSNGIATGGYAVNLFQNPAAAFADYRNPILGLDTKDTSYVNGLGYWNLDFSVRKNVRVAESIALEFQGNFVDVLNHNQWLDPPESWGLYSPSTFGNLGGSAQENLGGNRSIQLAARVRF